MVELVETHCHLFQPPLLSDWEGAIGRSAASGVSAIVIPAYDRASWARIDEMITQQNNSKVTLYAAYGVHPWVAAEGGVSALRQRLEGDRVVAVGEIGLDSMIEGADIPQQMAVLREQLQLAVAMDLPVILHCRGLFEQMLGLLREMRSEGKNLHGVIHAFTKSIELARRFTDLGLHLGFGGAVTRQRAGVRRTVAAVKEEHILLETDAPSIGLEEVRAHDAEPMHVRDVALAIAEIRGQTLADVAGQTTKNAKSLFRIDIPSC